MFKIIAENLVGAALVGYAMMVLIMFTIGFAAVSYLREKFGF